MKMKYWRLNIKGERSADEIQSSIGQSGGNVLRIHFEGGETQVYFAAESAATKAMKKPATVEEVSADEATRFGGKKAK
jgi:hypothetical protein